MRNPTSNPDSASPMAVTPIPKLLRSLGIPLICSLVIQACYNIVDSYFVSAMQDTAEVTGMGDYAMNALTLAFPIQMLIVALGVGTGVGVNALLARSMGQGDREKAGQVAGNGLFLGVCIYVLFLLFGLFGVRPYLLTQTSDPLVLELAGSYLTICCVYSFGQVLFTIYEKLLQATGHAVLSTIAQVSGAVTNIILDPILIFGYFGAPELGVAGAAYATVIGQMVSFVLFVVFQYTCNREVPAGVRYLIPEGKVMKEILSVGFPAIIMQAVGSFLTYGVNVIFGTLSASAVTAYGVYYKIQQFAFFAAFGMNNAMIPVIAFNYGSGDKERVRAGIHGGVSGGAGSVRQPDRGHLRPDPTDPDPLHPRGAHHRPGLSVRRRQHRLSGGVPGVGAWGALYGALPGAAAPRSAALGMAVHPPAESGGLVLGGVPGGRGHRTVGGTGAAETDFARCTDLRKGKAPQGRKLLRPLVQGVAEVSGRGGRKP